ncbi:MAG: hypothetical protein A2176_01205 [Spirochaetes bacterium RBG_13_51_14]|nr:MAG: hypothetical protein A2176_01205 [Spirochaetes bacterium RBG_13_51_14]
MIFSKRYFFSILQLIFVLSHREKNAIERIPMKSHNRNKIWNSSPYHQTDHEMRHSLVFSEDR